MELISVSVPKVASARKKKMSMISQPPSSAINLGVGSNQDLHKATYGFHDLFRSCPVSRAWVLTCPFLCSSYSRPSVNAGP